MKAVEERISTLTDRLKSGAKTTFDLEKGMRVEIQADVEEEGSCILNAQKFSQTVRVMEGEEVTLTVSENLQACITSGKSSHRMNALPASDFPKLLPLR